MVFEVENYFIVDNHHDWDLIEKFQHRCVVALLLTLLIFGLGTFYPDIHISLFQNSWSKSLKANKVPQIPKIMIACVRDLFYLWYSLSCRKEFAVIARYGGFRKTLDFV